MMYKFRIKLKEISAPEVWREVLIPKGNTFKQFHVIIQTAFGWKNEHLFEFLKDGCRIAIPSEYDLEYDVVTYDADKMLISDYFGKDGKDVNDAWDYTYDLGDSWEHEIIFLGVDDSVDLKYPKCLDGGGTCPPENCGGVSGYEELKKVFSEEPDSEEAESYREWLGLEKGENWNVDVVSPEYLENSVNKIFRYNSDVMGLISLDNLAEEDFYSIPIFRQAKFLFDFLDRESKLKLTKTGALPVKWVQDLYHLGATCDWIESGIIKLRLEFECRPVRVLKKVLLSAGLVKIRMGYLTLTTKGKKALVDNRLLLSELLNVFVNNYSVLIADLLMEGDSVPTVGLAYSINLLSIYGQEERSSRFYSDAYYDTFPELLWKFYESSSERNIHRCFSLRFFERFMHFFGFVEFREVSSFANGDDYIMVKKAGAFDKVFGGCIQEAFL